MILLILLLCGTAVQGASWPWPDFQCDYYGCSFEFLTSQENLDWIIKIVKIRENGFDQGDFDDILAYNIKATPPASTDFVEATGCPNGIDDMIIPSCDPSDIPTVLKDAMDNNVASCSNGVITFSFNGTAPPLVPHVPTPDAPLSIESYRIAGESIVVPFAQQGGIIDFTCSSPNRFFSPWTGWGPIAPALYEFTGKFDYLEPNVYHYIPIMRKAAWPNGMIQHVNVFRMNRMLVEITPGSGVFSCVNFDAEYRDGQAYNIESTEELPFHERLMRVRWYPGLPCTDMTTYPKSDEEVESDVRDLDDDGSVDKSAASSLSFLITL
jgi:hypothetical protein